MEAFPSKSTFRRQRCARAILWIVLLALAFFLRVAPIRSALPYLVYIDEGHVLHHVTQILRERALDTGFYNYPALPSYLIAATVLAYSPIYRHMHGHSWRDDLPTSNYYDVISPTEIIVIGRVVVALASVATVALAGILASSIAGARAGFLALLFTALCPALVSRGSIVIVDTVATFFVLLTLFFCQRMRTRATLARSGAGWFALCAGLASGFSFASKYTDGVVFTAVLTTIFLLPKSTRERLKLALLSGAALVAGIIFATPAIILNPGKIVATLRDISGFYNVLSSQVGYFGAALSPEELGIPLVVVGFAGIIFLLRGKASRPMISSWLVFAAFLIAVLITAPFQPFRNLLPLAPLICLAAALCLARGHVGLTSNLLRRRVHFWLAPIVAFFVAISLAIATARDFRQHHDLVDSRALAIKWLRRHSNPSERILALEQLAIFPREWKQVPAAVTVASWFDAPKILAQEKFDYVVTSQFDLRFSNDPKRWTEQDERWTNDLEKFPRRAAFGHVPCFIIPGVWRTNDERIVILQTDPLISP